MVAEIDRSELLIEILNELGRALLNIDVEKNRYRELCSTVGKAIRATLPNGEIIEDTAIGIGSDGSLLLNSREISVGDIVHLR
jgi:BirA family biotin operon repressor/biotin-[acetyl-CoA-carboxylase] ligase